jgi:YbgC/YbaW family acyl-CoA thioester hydrolase
LPGIGRTGKENSHSAILAILTILAIEVMSQGFRYSRRVQFAETDLAGIVHFSWMFRYMEEAEHALWRAAELSVVESGSGIGWPRVAASFEFRNPLHFEEEFDVVVRLKEAGRRALHYEHTIMRGTTVIGTGTMTVVCIRHTAGEPMQAVEVPAHIIEKLRIVQTPSPNARPR